MNDNKRIAFNTSVLYVKLVISIIVGLYTSRLILLALGASDFGLYSVVGGIVTLLNTIGITMCVASYRYISVEIGKEGEGNINKVFNTIFVVHVVLALLLLVLGGAGGAWYVEKYLNVEEARRPDALFVLMCSLFAGAASVISYPSNGLIVAREKFLFTSIVEIIQNLVRMGLIAFLVCDYDGDRLRLYSWLMALTYLTQPITYTVYCFLKERSIIKWHFNPCWRDYKEIIVYTWWLVCSSIAFLGNCQGVAVIINLFFGTVVNAAYGIAMQVQNYTTMFVKNLMQATSPQIMKSYGKGDHKRALNLVYKMSKYSYLILLIIAVPAIISIEEVLKLWLKKVPEYTSLFVTLLLINGLVLCFNTGFDALIQASGKIKKNQLGYTFINISILPILYVLYKIGLPCYTSVLVSILLGIVTVIFQCYIMKELSKFNVYTYLKETVLPCCMTTVIAIAALLLMYYHPTVDITSLVINSIVSLLWVGLCVLIFGLKQTERQKAFEIVKQKIRK